MTAPTPDLPPLPAPDYITEDRRRFWNVISIHDYACAAILADRAADRALEAVPEKEWHRDCTTLTALQLRHALDFAAPDFDVDEEQRETQVSIAWAPAGATHTDEGDPDPAGYKVWLTDYPEEGSIPLDESPAGFPVKSAERGRVIAALAAESLASPAASPVRADMVAISDEQLLVIYAKHYPAPVVYIEGEKHGSKSVLACLREVALAAAPQPSADMVPKGYKLVTGEAYGQRYVSLVAPDGKIIVNAYEQGAPEMFAFLSALATTAQPAAPTSIRPDPKRWAHVAVSEGGELRWMTGRKFQECELYTPIDALAQTSQPAAPTETDNDLPVPLTQSMQSWKDIEVVSRVMRAAGKTVKEVRNPGITARDSIILANYITEQQGVIHKLMSAPPWVAKFFIEEEMAGLLRQTIGDDGEPYAITLEVGDGHSGFGLYVSLSEYPEEGAIQLVECVALAQPSQPAETGGEQGMSTLAQCIDRLVFKHDGLRAAARASGLDAGYLSRLQSGSKEHPSERTLQALGIESRVHCVMSRQRPRPIECMSPHNAAAYHGGEDDGL